MIDFADQNPGARFLLVAACAVVVAWGLQFAAPILLPFALALFLSVLTLPIVAFLRQRKVPNALATVVGMAFVAGIFAILIILVTNSFDELRTVLPGYRRSMSQLQESWIQSLQTQFPQIAWREYISFDVFDTGVIFDFLTGTIGRAASLLSQTFLVFLIMFFVLAETTVLPAKLEAITGDATAGTKGMQKVIREVQTYLGIKTAISLLTGVLIGVWAAIMQLDFPILLGVVAFVLNYIPTVGSILAAIPAVVLSLILFGSLGHAVIAASGYLAVNTVFGNIIEPNLMGRRLGLSTLVVILSLLFWGWTWGPVGALLSVPLTMVVKIWLENNRDLRWIAVLIDKQPPVVPLVPPPGVAGVSPARDLEGSAAVESASLPEVRN